MNTEASSLLQNVSFAVSRGGPWSPPAGHPANLAETLVRAARHHPSNGVGYLDAEGAERWQSYPELLDAACRVLSGMRSRGWSAGQTVLFQLDDNLDFVTAFWACALGGYVPVPVSIAPTYEAPHSILAKLKNAWTMLESPPILATAGLANRLRAWGAREALEGLKVEVVDELRMAQPTDAWHRSEPGDLALLLLTSGSTGLPKAVRQTHGSLTAWAGSAVIACEFGPGDVSLNWMPLDHVGGLVMFHLRDVMAGCRQWHALTEPVLQNPLLWLDWIQRYRATITWAPNFAYGLINDRAAEVAAGRWDLSSMRFILNGGEAIVSRTARRFLQLLTAHGLPGTAMRPAWGMSETSSGVTYSRRFQLETTSDDDAFVNVGAAIPGIELRIVDEHDRLLPEGRTGRLQIRGISITQGYHRNPEANEKSFTKDGWFVTGDLGVIKDGQVAITGREKDVIIINGANFYSQEIEAVVESVMGVEVSFTAACATRPSGENTDRIAIFFVPNAAGRERLGELIKLIRTAVAQKEGVTADFIIPLEKTDIPKTAIGKIQRAALREKFERGDFAKQQSAAQQAPAELFVKAWREQPIDEGGLPRGSVVLVFVDGLGLGQRLADGLRQQGHVCVTVSAGSVCERLSQCAWTIRQGSAEDYGTCLAAAMRENGAFTHVVHAWAYPRTGGIKVAADLEEAQEAGSLSLLRLVRAWPAVEAGGAVRLLVVTSCLRAVAAEPVDSAKGPMLGLMRTLAHEFTWLKHVHLDLAGDDLAADLLAVQREMAAKSTGEAAVRGGRRFVPGLKRLPYAAATEPPFVRGGLYVLSGGLGGIGQVVAKRLTERYDACVVLLGRRPLDGQDSAARERRAALAALQNNGRKVVYEHGDLFDPVFINSAVERAVARWRCCLSGVIHLAGAYREKLLSEETDQEFLELLRPKLLGAWSLNEVARKHPACVFVHFSSMLSQFGALGTGAYAAANSSLDVFAHHQRHSGQRAFGLLWSLWVDTGMGRGYETGDAMSTHGYLQLTPDRGFELLERALGSDHSQVLVGLDSANRSLRRYFDPSELQDEAAGSRYVAPRNAIESKLVEMWQELLGVPRVGVTDNFFELGGRSLLAARLFGRIDKELGRRLPLAALFKSPTVEGLAALLGEGRQMDTCYVLPIQTGGQKTPLFCMPGGGSDMIMFKDLARELGPDQPVYGLQASELDTTTEAAPNSTVEEISARFVREIRTVQPRGPYYLSGHCFGSLLALEVAQQLMAQGEEVPLVAMIDNNVGDILPDRIKFTLGDKIALHRERLAKLGLAGKVKYFLDKLAGRRQMVENRTAWFQHVARFDQIHRRYVPRPYAGRLAIFMAEDAFFYNRYPEHDARLYWVRFARDGADVYRVSGDHMTILKPPHVRDLAEKLARHLPAAAPTAAARA